jgi:phage terminase Nu1 subunit (DNA packaging protein)
VSDLRQWTELEFRDGKRDVPDYLVVMMYGIETHRLTYDQAVDAANKKAESDLLNAQQDKVLAAHFKELR